MGAGEVDRFCQLDEPSSRLLEIAMKRYSLSARAYHRVLKLGRTIADLKGNVQIGEQHIAEALIYRTAEGL